MFNKNDDLDHEADEALNEALSQDDVFVEFGNEFSEPEAEAPANEPVSSPDGLVIVEFLIHVNAYRKGDQAALTPEEAEKWVANGSAVRV